MPKVNRLTNSIILNLNSRVAIVPLVLILVFITLSRSFGQNFERYKQLSDTVCKSQYLGYDKVISVIVPKEFQRNTKKTFPLIIIFDSQNTRSYKYLQSTIDYLTSNDQIPASVIIGVESPMNKRFKETDLPSSNPSSLGYKNEKFVFDELVPLAKRLYSASEFLLLIGHSRCGYFSTYLLTQESKKLNAVISISPFYTQNNVDLIDSLSSLYKREKLDHKIYYIYSAGADFQDDFKRMETLTELFRNTGSNIRSKGFYFPEADHNVTPGLTAGVGLYEVFEFWRKEQDIFLTSKNTDLKLKPVAENSILNHYGTAVSLSLGVLNGKGWQLYNDKNYPKAIEVWMIMLGEYPNFSEGYLAIMQAQKALSISIQETTRLFKSSLEQSEFYTAERKAELIKQLLLLQQ